MFLELHHFLIFHILVIEGRQQTSLRYSVEPIDRYEILALHEMQYFKYVLKDILSRQIYLTNWMLV